MSDARKALRDWQVNNLHSGPFAMPQYDDFARIVEGIERDAARIAELEAALSACEAWIVDGGHVDDDDARAGSTGARSVYEQARAALTAQQDQSAGPHDR